ncbi:MAG: hypothetical protein JWO81_466 [Alphaproteobacteria bacterium]|nr:hypothetical protein [Alphaproteobacteria bacterium]
MDGFDLDRFVQAQAPVYAGALAELRQGRKQGHWMWFVFPQIAGLGRSATAVHYAIFSLAEARAYLAHPLLGPRLAESSRAVLAQRGRVAEAIFGRVDATKFRSSMTLFEAASGAPAPFGEALDVFYGGARDQATLALLREG